MSFKIAFIIHITTALIYAQASAGLSQPSQVRFKAPNIELGGNIDFARINGDYTSQTILNFNPFLSKYFSWLFVGPILGFNIINSHSYSSSKNIVYGVHFGSILWNPINPAFPYIDLGVARAKLSQGYYDEISGLAIPIEIGIKTRIGSSAFLNSSIFYSFQNLEDHTYRTFGLSVGFSVYR